MPQQLVGHRRQQPARVITWMRPLFRIGLASGSDTSCLNCGPFSGTERGVRI